MNKENRKKILFNTVNITNWIGGIYYVKNIINLIMHSEKLRTQYEIHLLVSSKNRDVFKEYENIIVIKEIDIRNNYLEGIYFVFYMLKNKIDYWYAVSSNIIERVLVSKAIFWIPDFQYLYFPEYFSSVEKKIRDHYARYISKKKNYLVLSSNAAYEDFREFYKNSESTCIVVHFTSDIVNIVSSISQDEEKEILKKYKLKRNNYIYIPNQFWQHKNHLVVLQMIEKYMSKRKSNVQFVFTGQMYDYRNKEYAELIERYFTKNELKDNIKNLGLIDRREQLIIMKNAMFLIQPSLFEGWGTVLEDAKVLDKRVILSDIKVHIEQKYEKCILFKKDSADDLMNKVIFFMGQPNTDNMNEGIKRFHRDSKEYARKLEKVFLK